MDAPPEIGCCKPRLVGAHLVACAGEHRLLALCTRQSSRSFSSSWQVFRAV